MLLTNFNDIQKGMSNGNLGNDNKMSHRTQVLDQAPAKEQCYSEEIILLFSFHSKLTSLKNKGSSEA